MNKKFAIISISFIIFAGIIGSVTGIPISSQIGVDECKTTYKKYLFPRHLCQYLTSGHCATTDLNKYNAQMEIAHCLCEKYLSKPSDELKKQILQMCELIKPDCSSRVERIKIDYCNEAGLNSVECNEYFGKNDIQEIDFICQHKKQIFYKILLH